jgi:predicted Ser/Thr protein kinase
MTPEGFVKTGYVTVSSSPGKSSIPVYKKLGGKYAKFYTMWHGKPGNPIGHHVTVENASGTVKSLGGFLKTNKKAKTPAPAKAPSPAKAKSPAKAPSPNMSGGFNKTNLITSTGYKVYKGPISKKYYYSYPGSIAKHDVTNKMILKKPNGSTITLKNLIAKSPSPTKAKSPAKAPSPVKANAMAGYTKTNLKTAGASALNVYKKNDDYYYQKNGNPQKLGLTAKVKKPNGTVNHIKWINGYTKTNLKYSTHNVYQKNGNYYYSDLYYTSKPNKLSTSSLVKKSNGTYAKISNLSKTGKHMRLGDLVWYSHTDNQKHDVYYTNESGNFTVYYKKGGSYYSLHSLNFTVYKSTDTAMQHPMKLKEYLITNNAYTPTGLSSTNGKNVYKHLDGSLAIKNGTKYTAKFKGKHGAEMKLGIVKAPKAKSPNTSGGYGYTTANFTTSTGYKVYKNSATHKYYFSYPDSVVKHPVTDDQLLKKANGSTFTLTNLSTKTTSPPPAIVSVSLVPVVKPGPDHVKAKVSEFTTAVDKVAKRLKKLQDVTSGSNNKNTNYENMCMRNNGMAWMKRTNTLKYKYSKVDGNLSGGWKTILSRSKPIFTYGTYEHKLSYAQYLAHQQLLFNYGRNVNSFENVRLSDMMDLKWFAAQDKYIRSLSTREIFTVSGYSYNGDTWAHSYLDGTFDYDRFRNSVPSPSFGTYFAFFFQARDFYKINTGNILKDYESTVNRVKSDKNNEHVKSIIHMFINELNEIIRKAPAVTRAFILFRGNKNDKYMTGAVNNLYTTERFCSASVAGTVAHGFANGHEIQRITILKGSKCLLMFGVTQVSNEWEILLPRGSTYQIVKRRQNMKTLASTNSLCSTHHSSSIKNLTDVVLLGTVEEAKAVEAVPVEVHPTTNVHVMQKYIKKWPVTITGILGKGGMGVVYQGTNTKLKKNVAIKFQKKSINSNTEKAALKKLFGLKIAPQFHRNKNIIANNYLHSEAPKVKVGNQMSVMESNLIKGPALKSWFTGQPIPKDIANKVKNSISKMHSRGVIHGNLHRNNIIISNNNKRAYIIDFGRALVTNKSYNTPNNANNKLKTLGTPGKSHGKNTVTTPNGVFHFFNGKFLKGLKVANS